MAELLQSSYEDRRIDSGLINQTPSEPDLDGGAFVGIGLENQAPR